MGGGEGAWGVGRGCIMCPTLRAMEGGTIMKFVCTAKCQYMSYCLKDVRARVDISVQ